MSSTNTTASLENAIRALQSAFKILADEAEYDFTTNAFRKPNATTFELSASLHNAWEHVTTALGLDALDLQSTRTDLALARLVELEQHAS